jgi:hypothetical protein
VTCPGLGPCGGRMGSGHNKLRSGGLHGNAGLPSCGQRSVFSGPPIKMDSTSPVPRRPDTPRPPDIMVDLRTSSLEYNHGGYYAPSDPTLCTMPGGPCGACQDRIDEAQAAEALRRLSTRPPFLEPCPACSEPSTFVTHESRGLRQCNGCPGKLCIRCFFGARYHCPLRTEEFLLPPSAPLTRQEAVGVQSPRAETKTENK